MTAQKYFYSLSLLGGGGGTTLIFISEKVVIFIFSGSYGGREEGSIGTLAPLLRYLKKPRLWPQQERQKAISLINEQNNNVARVACFFVHFFVIPAQWRHEMTKF